MVGDIVDKNLKDLAVFSIIAVVIDQLIKIVISSKVALDSSFPIVKGFWYITNVHNTGAAFSILEGSRLLFIAVGIIAIVLVALYYKSIEDKTDYDVVVFSLLIGGIIGNMIDRIIHGYVIDYLSFNIFGYNFPVFNLADTFIVIAIVLFVFRIIKEDVWS